MRIRGDISLMYRQDTNGGTSLRWYNPTSRHSWVGFDLSLEPGLRAFVSERVQKIPNDRDLDSLDEAYVEETGSWRLGKQVIPFGKGLLMRDSALAARSDTFLFLQYLPFKVAAVDDTRGRPRGIAGRVGGRELGASFAFGEHFGANAETLGLFHSPETHIVASRGFRRAFGFDASRKWRKITVAFEAISLEESQDPGQVDVVAAIGKIEYTIKPRTTLALEFGKTSAISGSYFMLTGLVPFFSNGQIEAELRRSDSRQIDFALGVRVKF